MKVAEVKKLPPLERFLYWIRERHNIYLKRQAGVPKPWTDDEVLQTFFFTNPYRENDKVTIWFRENIREPLRNRPEVLFATVCFRWFNLPEPTGRILMTPKSNAHTNFEARKTLTPLGRLMLSLLCNWDPQSALSVLSAVRDSGKQVFTGAFMVNSPPGEPKLEAIIRRVNNVWEKRDYLIDEFTRGAFEGKITLQGAHELLTEFDGMGGFMAYEVVCDLMYTYLLEKAPDRMTWCNPGPGCVRGIYRILDRDFEKGNNSSSPPKPKDFMDQMRSLLATAQRRFPKMPPMDMRTIEHSLCEFDKYERGLWGDGKLKRRYAGK